LLICDGLFLKTKEKLLILSGPPHIKGTARDLNLRPQARLADTKRS
jgi:hypothetical protein